MAVDATGTPTSLGIPKFNVDADAPSGLGTNAMMDAIDALLQSRKGSLTLGDGVAAGGTILARPQTTTQYTFQSLPANNGPNNYFQIRGDGKIEWGAGAGSAVDVNLYRGGADLLKTDDSLIVGGQIYPSSYIQSIQSLGGSVLLSSASGDANNRFQQFVDGRMTWGDGTNAPDTNLYRLSAANLKTDGTFWAGASVVVDATNGGNKLYFGSSLDTNLYRGGTSQLTTDGSLRIASEFTLGGNTAGQLRLVGIGNDTLAVLNTGNGYGFLRMIQAQFDTDTTLTRYSTGTLILEGGSTPGLNIGTGTSGTMFYTGTKSGVGGGRIESFAHWGFGVDNTTVGWGIDVNGSVHAGSFPVSSDARLKKNVRQIEGALDALLKIRGVRFEWKTMEESGTPRDYSHLAGDNIGVIAQEVQAVFPELIDEWEVTEGAAKGETRMAVDYSRLAPILIEGLRELKERLDVLEAQAR